MYSLLTTSLVLLLASCAKAQPRSSDKQPQTVKRTLRLPLSQGTPHSLDRRQLSTSLSNQIRTYTIDISIGSDAQELTLSLDTGSAETFVNGPSCTDCTGGSYDPGKSANDRSRDDLGAFEKNYVDGRKVSGRYVGDTMKIGNSVIQDTIFAVSDNATGSGSGIMGIGLPSPEAKYPSILDDMKAQGLISSRS